jgi:hypothetical protein
MENQNTTQGNPLPPVPGAVAVLVFGIVAICTFWTGLVGLIFAIISMSKSKKVKKIFDESAGMYNPGSMGLILSIFFILYWIIVGLFLGALANM